MLLFNLWYFLSITSRLLRAGMFKILFSFNVFLFSSPILMKLVFPDRASYSGSVGTTHNFVDLSVQVLRAFRLEMLTTLYPPLLQVCFKCSYWYALSENCSSYSVDMWTIYCLCFVMQRWFGSDIGYTMWF